MLPKSMLLVFGLLTFVSSTAFGQSASDDEQSATASTLSVTRSASGTASITVSNTNVPSSVSVSDSANATGTPAINSTSPTSSVIANSSATVAPPVASSGSSTSDDDPQSALTLDPAVIATGFAQDGQQEPTVGQVPSLTSTNNFINFCLTVSKPLTNGLQISEGSCNPAPMGVIAATTNMPSIKFTFPKNGDTIPAGTSFTVTMAVRNLQTGSAVNPRTNYLAAPQVVNDQGNIIGNVRLVIEELDSLDQTTLTDPNRFAFFKGIGAAAANGVVSGDVPNGLAPGFYRATAVAAAANIQPAIVAVAQHGNLNDAVYFTVA